MLGTPPKNEAKLQRGWRLRESLVKYVKETGKSRGNETRTVEEALAIHQALTEKLTPEKLQLQRFAVGVGLDYETQLPEIIARAVLAGLEAHEASRK